MRVHFIAIGGSVMHNLALALHAKGFEVSGSDDEFFEPSKSRLAAAGLLPSEPGWHAERITKDLDAVILGMHAMHDNPELVRAKELGIKVYTISCGTNGKMSKMRIPGYGVQSVKTEIDETLLKFIAQETGGTYFVANNKTKLKQIYDEIDKMEKTIIDEEVIENKGDEFLPFLLIALFLFLFELVARYTFLRTNP